VWSVIVHAHLCSSLQMRQSLEVELAQTKENLSQASLELRAMIRAFKEKRLLNRSDMSLAPEPLRRIEVWLDDGQWSLMQDDGQLQVGGAISLVA
jgi:hypothetical protein